MSALYTKHSFLSSIFIPSYNLLDNFDNFCFFYIFYRTCLVPVISAYMPDNDSRRKFWKFNRTFPLLNLHLFNLPFCAIEFILTNRCLTFFDLWFALVVAFVYVMFYLNVLDAYGLHFYIIFTPRTGYCFIPYCLILSFYYAIYHSWNAILGNINQMSCN